MKPRSPISNTLTRLCTIPAPACSALLMLLASAGSAAGTTLYVCPASCQFSKIQAAVDAAVSGDTIDIAAGRYVENVTIAGKSLQLVGAGNGRTEVDGASLGRVFTLGTGQGGPDEAIGIAHLTATHGMADGGAGILVQAGAHADLEGVIVVSNVAHVLGAGILIATSPSGPVNIINGCAIDNNKIDSTASNGGGGIQIAASNVLIEGSTITRNISIGTGGGVQYLTYNMTVAGAVTITDSSIVDNQATNPHLSDGFVGGGGAIYFDGYKGGTLTISKTDISRNISEQYGGALFAFGKTVVSDSVIGRNTTTFSGGGIFTGGSGQPITLNNVYIIENTAQNGVGGMDNAGSPLTSVRTVIQDNVPNNCLGPFCPP